MSIMTDIRRRKNARDVFIMERGNLRSIGLGKLIVERSLGIERSLRYERNLGHICRVGRPIIMKHGRNWNGGRILKRDRLV